MRVADYNYCLYAYNGYFHVDPRPVLLPWRCEVSEINVIKLLNEKGMTNCMTREIWKHKWLRKTKIYAHIPSSLFKQQKVSIFYKEYLTLEGQISNTTNNYSPVDIHTTRRFGCTVGRKIRRFIGAQIYQDHHGDRRETIDAEKAMRYI